MKNNKTKPKSTVPVEQGREAPTAGKMTERKLIVSLIRDDLVNYRLLMGLHELGLVTELYFLNVSQTVFDYLGIQSRIDYDPNYERYEKMKAGVMALNLEKDHKKLEALAEKIYRELMTMKLMQDK